MLQDLTADDLASALQESGIKWRTIVISACHAGSFIDALRNPDTIVITAAEADKASFGCSDDRNLTYFGEAFYRDALPRMPATHITHASTMQLAERREFAMSYKIYSVINVAVSIQRHTISRLLLFISTSVCRVQMHIHALLGGL